MTPVDEFVAKRNIHRFTDLLCTEDRTARRQTLQQLLLAEEDRFGFRTWQSDRINKQEELIGWIESRGQDSKYARALLDTFCSINDTLLAMRTHVAKMF